MDDGAHREDAGRPVARRTRRWPGGYLAVVLVTWLASCLLCAAPVVLTGVAATGLIQVLRRGPWPELIGAVLLLVILVVWGLGTRRTRIGPARSTGPVAADPRAVPPSLVPD